MGPKELPSRDQLRDYNYAVAGHAGTMCDADGELFIKPCTQSEIDFYQSANRRHPEFADLMPLFMGSLTLSDPAADGVDEAVAGVISEVGDIKSTKEQIAASVAAQMANAPTNPQPVDNVTWVPTKGKKIKTDKAVVLENTTCGFKQANILDVKLGVRLWADDAPLQKKHRFDKISSETTHGNLGFRIAGMRVFRGSDDASELDEEGYKVYDKDYGRLSVNDDNVVDEFRRFVFNRTAGIDQELGKAVCVAFARDLGRVQEVMTRHESRMYSTSLLFVFEGDGEALRAAIEANNVLADSASGKSLLDRTKRMDSGIGLDDEDDDDFAQLEASLPQIYTLKLIDFAHAQWTPGQGPDENILTGPVASSTRTITLRPAWEWRFEAPPGRSLVLKVLSGTAEKDGVELAPRNAYTLSGIKSKILTWHGCELEVEGRCDDDFVAEYATPAANPANAYVNIHARLGEMRAAAARDGREGPRVLIAGPPNSGKTTVARTLTSYATRQGYQPIAVNTDPKDGMLSLPGTLSAGVFATVMDPEAADGWGSTPTSGPSVVPVKLPLVNYYGRSSAEDDPDFHKELVSRLAGSVSGRLSDDGDVRSSGIIVDSMGISEKSKVGLDLLAHVVEELSVNIVVVVGSTRIHAELTKRFASERTSLCEPILVVLLDRSEGVVEREESFMEHAREQTIKEYFFGDVRRALSPQIQQVDFDSLVIYKMSDYSKYDQESLAREEPSSLMQHWTLAVMHASTKDAPETVRAASVMGFVYVSDVDEERRKIKVLAPVGGRLGDRPLVWGKWPEPFMNLLG
ncbi:Calcium-transporting ATPase 3 [Tolypocladium capitatum]|uniref:Polynucleotide 5'-hydroxyl-kinase GRC3 n=1 Tax=Tolypocladium capitatum TaxID=45235 RepID=A0A2K3QFM9_9HYPO|nr:Calcium-transporting ATPase 3 [Tolypocladium capitatum]